MNKKLLSLYSLKFNPFAPDVPAEALWVPPAVESFCWRIEAQTGEGGFALAIGEPGTGKSAALRILRARLSAQRDVTVGILTRPQAGLADFYRELGDLFGAPLQPHNRWASAKVLREKWHKHIDSSLCRPCLLIDESQECCVPVLSELRLLSSTDLDSRSILTIVLAGDSRLGAKLDSPELLPLASRVRSPLAADRGAFRAPTGGVPRAPAQGRRQSETDEPDTGPDPVRARGWQSAAAYEHGERSAGGGQPPGAGAPG
jgi:general secretion pathway protein A